MHELSNWRLNIRQLFRFLSIVAIAWVVFILWESWPQAKESIVKLEPKWLLLTLFGTTIGGYLLFEGFLQLFRFTHPDQYNRLQLAHLFFTGQLMKHLPGRIWGIGYQASKAQQASLAEWTVVNVVFMLLTIFFSVGVAAIFFISSFSIIYTVAFSTLFVLLYYLLWRNYSIGLAIKILGKLSFKAAKSIVVALQHYENISELGKAKIFFTFIASWLFYYLGWGFFISGWPQLTFHDGLMLCALYTLSWFIGYISFVTPSGAGIREIAFLYLASSFPSDTVAAMMVMGRLFLLASDFILGIAFIRWSYEDN